VIDLCLPVCHLKPNCLMFCQLRFDHNVPHYLFAESALAFSFATNVFKVGAPPTNRKALFI
jgi:hypothetical protein